MTSVHIPGWELQESSEEVLKKKKTKSEKNLSSILSDL